MASGPSIDDNISLLLNPSTPGQTDSSGNPLERPGSASLDDGDPSKKSQSPAIMMRSTKVETLTPREMEVLALAWDNMKDSRANASDNVQIDYKEMSKAAGYTEESARVAMGKIKRKLANAAASEREKRGINKGQSGKGTFGRPRKNGINGEEMLV